MSTTHFETVKSITGQVRRRRRLCKELFFIDLKPSDEAPHTQIFFRSDDGTLDYLNSQDIYRECKPGHIITVIVGEPLCAEEQKGKSYKVWQSIHL